MKRMLMTTLIGILLAATQVSALEVTALAPIRGTPGTLIAVYGGPFTSQIRLFLGEQYVPPRVILNNHMEFIIPDLSPGSYTLTVQSNTETVDQAYQFEVMAAAPEIASIEPRILDACPLNPQNPVQVSGNNFQPGAILLVNEKVVPSQIVNSTLIEVQLPEMQQPGVYGVAVRNPDGATSLPYSLWVNDVPEISSIERGENQVNHYEVIIHGKNFHFNSTLVVREPKDSTIGQTYHQFSFGSRSNSLGQDIFKKERTRLDYVDCQTLVYHRYPSSYQNRELSLQVFNPDGRKTDLYSVSLP